MITSDDPTTTTMLNFSRLSTYVLVLHVTSMASPDQIAASPDQIAASPDQIRAIGMVLVDPSKALAQRFRALFTLRNLGGNAPAGSLNITQCPHMAYTTVHLSH